MSSHRSAALTSSSLQNADLVVVMSRDQEKGLSARVKTGSTIVVLGDLDPLPIRQRTIHDPWDGPIEAFAESYARINRSVRELAKIVWGG